MDLALPQERSRDMETIIRLLHENHHVSGCYITALDMMENSETGLVCSMRLFWKRIGVEEGWASKGKKGDKNWVIQRRQEGEGVCSICSTRSELKRRYKREIEQFEIKIWVAEVKGPPSMKRTLQKWNPIKDKHNTELQRKLLPANKLVIF